MKNTLQQPGIIARAREVMAQVEPHATPKNGLPLTARPVLDSSIK
jgi:hypothetical protein